MLVFWGVTAGTKHGICSALGITNPWFNHRYTGITLKVALGDALIAKPTREAMM